MVVAPALIPVQGRWRQKDPGAHWAKLLSSGPVRAPVAKEKVDTTREKTAELSVI